MNVLIFLIFLVGDSVSCNIVVMITDDHGNRKWIVSTHTRKQEHTSQDIGDPARPSTDLGRSSRFLPRPGDPLW